MTVGSLRTPLALLLDLAWTFAAVAVFVRVLGQGDGPAPSLVLAAVIVGGSFLLARLLQATDVDEGAIRVLGVGISVGVIFIAARIEYAPGEWPFELGWAWSLLTDPEETIRPNGHVVAGLVALLPFWLRGVLRGQNSEVEFDDVLTSASLGLVPVILAALTQPETREPSAWGAYAFGYCVLALVTLAVFRAPQADAPLLAFVQRWAWGFAALGGLAFVLALLAVGLDPNEFGFLSPIGDALGTVGRAIGDYVLAPIFWLIALPFRGLGALFGALFGDPAPPERPEPAPEEEKVEDDQSQPLWFRIVATIAAVLGVGLVAAIALTLLWYAFRRFVRDRKKNDRDRHDDIEPESSLADDIGAMLGAFGRRFRRSGTPASTIAIRRLYREMLNEAAVRGVERPVWATPTEFAPQLEARFRSSVPREITDAFVESRYGERAVDEADVKALRQRWREVGTDTSARSEF